MLRDCFWHSFHLIEHQEKNIYRRQKDLQSDATLHKNSKFSENTEEVLSCIFMKRFSSCPS